MKGFWIVTAIVLVSLFFLALFNTKYRVHYWQRGKIVEKIITQSHHGEEIVAYFLIVKFDNGEIQERKVEIETYGKFEQGEYAMFHRDSLKFN